MLTWDYQSDEIQSTGYEDVLDYLKIWNKEKFISETEESKTEIINNIFTVYRTKNIFPIQYYSQEGIKQEIQKCIDKEVTFDDNVLDLKFNQGSSLCRFLFPNLSTVECGGDKRTPYNKFYSDHMLKRAIEFCLKHKSSTSPVTPSGIKDGLEMLGGGVSTNFKPMNAKALYEKYTPKDGVIFDYACGFGGRMLGALSSKNNYKYFGVEPNTETYLHLMELGKHIESVTGRNDSFKIACKGSEGLNITKREFVDFAFSSPPYFSLEKYSDEPTQCYNKFTTLESWFEGYVYPTIKNIYDMLKVDRYYAVNIADFKVGSKTINFVDKWIEISEGIGFTFDHQIDMKLQARRGDGHDETNIRSKKEGIFVFKKN